MEPRADKLTRAAATVTALITAGALAILAVAKAHSTGLPAPPTIPSPVTHGVTVADSTPILVQYELMNYERINAITWDGAPAGTLPFNTSMYTPNPLANLFVSSSEVRDRRGKLLVQGSFGSKFFFSGAWADDGEHFCVMSPLINPDRSGVPTTLKLIDSRTGEAARDTVHVGTLYIQNFVNVVACSMQTDRAVIVQTGAQEIGTAQYWVVQVSDGKILWTHKFDLNALPVQIVSSPDAETIAESHQLASGGWYTTFFGQDGKASWKTLGEVKTFSSDGSMVLVDSGQGGGPTRILRGGRIVWSGPSGPGFYVNRFVAAPDGAGMAVGLHNPANTDIKSLSSSDLYIVAADGHVVTEFADSYW